MFVKCLPWNLLEHLKDTELKVDKDQISTRDGSFYVEKDPDNQYIP